MKTENDAAGARYDKTEDARRASRFKFAQDRIKKITGGKPPLTGEQLKELAALLTGE